MSELRVRDLISYMRKCSSIGDVALYVIATVAVILLGMVTPAMTKLLFSTVVSTKNSWLLLGIFTLLMVTAVTKLIFSIINQLVLPRISTRIAIPLQAAFMMRTLTAPVSDVRGFSAGDLGTRLGALYNYIQVLLSMFLSSILTALCSLISFFQMFRYSPELAYVALGATAVILILNIVVVKKNYDLGCERMDSQAAESGMTYSLIDGIQKITVTGAEKRAFIQWSQTY